MRILLNFDKSKILRIIITSIVILALMLGGQWYYGKRVVARNLKNTLLQNKYVNNVEIAKEQEKVIITLSLKDVDNLQEVYHDIYSIAERQMKGRPFTLVIANKPNSKINNLYNENLQFIIYEALQTGKYTDMKAELDKLQHAGLKTSI